MADRREDDAIRTDRPTAPAATAASSTAADGLPTVREILTLEAVAHGVPEVLSGDGALDARVRWVHVSDSAGVARLLVGGELLLSTGSGWPTEPRELEAFVAELVEAGLSGLVLELGVHYRYVPTVVERAAREHGLALVALHREVKFVTLTEAVHSRIISEQTAALRARDEVRERFTALSLRGSPADFIVHQLAQTLGSAVVLENLAHEVVASEVPPAAEHELFSGWEARSRLAHRRHEEQLTAAVAAAAHDDWLIVPVEARGVRWGHLIALPGPAHPAGRASVLEQGAIALALGRLADGAADEWVRIGRQRLVDGLLAGRFAGLAGAVARLEAAGLPITGARVRGLVVSGAPVVDGAADAAARDLGGRAIDAAAPASAFPGPSARVVLLSLPGGSGELSDAAVRGFATTLVGGDAASLDRLVVSMGAAADGLDGLLGSVQEAIDLGRGPRPREARGLVVRRAEDRPLMRLVTSLRDDHRLLRHSERMLAPLIEYDLARGGDLLTVLGAMLAHPGNRTAAAAASHLSRSVFYQRLALIGDLLGVDLDDGEALTALHLALLVRRSAVR
ncbi:purine catabolism regulator [Agromyces sp. 3263]|uniref:PucR family transcriptional regulator n=1 Tax=Agromyces sp. 3263 TaxID=2817750 RepID=UPI00285E88A8|nr:PucR family transcriptional regulator [Agromyces sp. 3263]MDR6905275.1 purine catabolism regulator [Agromyces sp. 3263]